MSLLDSIQNQSKKHEFPFDHWEYNNALSDGANDQQRQLTPLRINLDKKIEKTINYLLLLIQR